MIRSTALSAPDPVPAVVVPARCTVLDEPVTLESVLAFCALCLLLELTPGPNTSLVLRHSLQDPRNGVTVRVTWLPGASKGIAARAVGWMRRPRVTRALDRVSAAVLAAFGVGTVVSAR